MCGKVLHLAYPAPEEAAPVACVTTFKQSSRQGARHFESGALGLGYMLVEHNDKRVAIGTHVLRFGYPSVFPEHSNRTSNRKMSNHMLTALVR